MTSLVSFRGWVFSDHHFNTWQVPGGRDLSITGNYVSGSSAPPLFGGITLDTKQRHYQVSTQPGYDLESQRSALLLGLRPDLSEESTLVELRSDGTTQMQLSARLKSLSTVDNVTFDLIFEAANPYAKSVTAHTTTVVGPDVPDQQTLSASIVTGGELLQRPVVRLFPLKQKTAGLGATTHTYGVTETSGNNLTNVAWTITFDHATAVTAGKSTAGGTDILVTVNGLAVDRSIMGANTSTCRVTFPLTVAANATAVVLISYAPTGQTYSGLTYAQDFANFTVAEQSGNSLANYPYRLVFDHASKVTAGRSKSSGADIRVFVDGVEQDRAISGVNTSTCKVWAKLSLTANATSVVCITTAASGYDYAGAVYTPGNAAIDLATSTNGSIVYTTPVFSNNDDSPFALKPVFMNLNATSNPTNYDVRNSTGTDPGVKASIMDIGSPAQNGNYIRVYGGGVRLLNLTARYDWGNGTTGALHSTAYIGESSNLSAWSILRTFARVPSGSGGTGPDTTVFSSGSVAGVVGLERTVGDPSQTTGTANTNFMNVRGSGSTELSLTVVAADVPLSTGLSAPTTTDDGEVTPYIFNGTLSDGTRSISLVNVAVSGFATSTNQISHGTAFDDASWTKTNASVTANAVANPVTGASDADKLVEDTSVNVTHFVSQGVSGGGDCTVEIWAMAAERSVLTINLVDNPFTSGIFARYNLSTGTIDTAATPYTGTGFTNGQSTISFSHGGWYRCTLKFTSAASALSISLELYNGTNTYTGDGTSGLYLYDARLTLDSGIIGPGIEIDCDAYQAHGVDVSGHTSNALAAQLRKKLFLGGFDENWLAFDPGGGTLTWYEPNMDADGVAIRITVADRWH